MIQTVSRPTSCADVSIVIPMLNEQENVAELYREIKDVIADGDLSWEAIFVDDGSCDTTVATLMEAAQGDPRVSIIELARRFGQTSALAAGFQHATGRYIVSLDADLQNDPRDIKRLIAKLEEGPGYDVVSGWRKDRQDRFFSRRLPSMVANWLIARLTWTRIHDFGCTLKVYRRETLEDVQLYGEMHRFLPAICQWRGARIAELVVNHRPREFGTSTYGMKRTVKVMLDLMTVKFLGDYLSKPIYFFGKMGLVTFALAFFTLFVAVMQRFGWFVFGGEAIHLNRNVLVLLAMMLCIMSVFVIMIGLLSELLVRIYHESQNIRPYRVRHIRRQHANGSITAGDSHVKAQRSARLVEVGEG